MILRLRALPIGTRPFRACTEYFPTISLSGVDVLRLVPPSPSGYYSLPPLSALITSILQIDKLRVSTTGVQEFSNRAIAIHLTVGLECRHVSNQRQVCTARAKLGIQAERRISATDSHDATERQMSGAKSRRHRVCQVCQNTGRGRCLSFGQVSRFRAILRPPWL